MTEEITTPSWGKRIIKALQMTTFGLLFIGGSLFLIFWNEGNGLHAKQSLKQAAKILITIPNTPVEAKNNLKVVYLYGIASTPDILTDKKLDISQNAVQLKRQVEMYQWKEEVETSSEKQIGSTDKVIKTYSYHQEWLPDLINSNRFKDISGHENPKFMPLHSEVQYASNVRVGDFKLPSKLIRDISGESTIDLSKVDLEKLKLAFNRAIHLQGDGLYLGDDERSPQTGDVRITLSAIYPDTVSIIAQQNGNTLQPYQAPAGLAVSLLEMGQVSPEEMIHNVQVYHRLITWLLRFTSLILMMIGFALLLGPLTVLADVLPFMGSLVGVGVGFLAFTLGLCIWLLAFSLAWFVVRPFMSLALILFALVVTFFILRYKKRILLRNKE